MPCHKLLKCSKIITKSHRNFRSGIRLLKECGEDSEREKARKRIISEDFCRNYNRPLPPNPVCPVYTDHDDGWKKYRNIVYFVCIPLIAFMSASVLLGGHHHEKPECRNFEYLRRFTKRFPWQGGDKKSFFHNDKANYPAGECKEDGPEDEEDD